MQARLHEWAASRPAGAPRWALQCNALHTSTHQCAASCPCECGHATSGCAGPTVHPCNRKRAHGGTIGVFQGLAPPTSVRGPCLFHVPPKMAGNKQKGHAPNTVPVHHPTNHSHNQLNRQRPPHLNLDFRASLGAARRFEVGPDLRRDSAAAHSSPSAAWAHGRWRGVSRLTSSLAPRRIRLALPC